MQVDCVGVKQCQELKEGCNDQLINQDETHGYGDESEVKQHHSTVRTVEHTNTHCQAKEDGCTQGSPPVTREDCEERPPETTTHITGWNNEPPPSTNILCDTSLISVHFDSLYFSACHPASCGVPHLFLFDAHIYLLVVISYSKL